MSDMKTMNNIVIKQNVENLGKSHTAIITAQKLRIRTMTSNRN